MSLLDYQAPADRSRCIAITQTADGWVIDIASPPFWWWVTRTVMLGVLLLVAAGLIPVVVDALIWGPPSPARFLRGLGFIAIEIADKSAGVAIVTVSIAGALGAVGWRLERGTCRYTIADGVIHATHGRLAVMKQSLADITRISRRGPVIVLWPRDRYRISIFVYRKPDRRRLMHLLAAEVDRAKRV